MREKKKDSTKSSAGALISPLDFRKPSVKAGYIICFIFLIILAVICIVPPVWIMTSSLKDTNEFYSIPPTLIPKSFHPEKIPVVWGKLKLGKSYINTIGYIAGSISCSVIFSGLMGYSLSKLKPAGHKVVWALIMLTMMVPNTVSMVPIYKNIISFPLLHVNLINTYIPMFMMAGANAFYVLVFKNFFDGIPSFMLEAARIDGCNEWRTFFSIMIPNSKPIILTAVILSFNGAWSDFFWPMMVLKNEDLYTVMVKIYSIANISQDQLVIALTFAMLPPIILFIFFQKYIMQGFSMSGFKM